VGKGTSLVRFRARLENSILRHDCFYQLLGCLLTSIPSINFVTLFRANVRSNLINTT